MSLSPQQLRAYVDYLRDLGVYDLYRSPQPRWPLPETLQSLPAPSKVPTSPIAPGALSAATASPRVNATQQAPPPQPPTLSPFEKAQTRAQVAAGLSVTDVAENPTHALPPELAAPMPKPNPLDQLFPASPTVIPAAARPAALETIRADIGDCTRCPLAYAGRHTIVFADGNPNADLMFVGEGPGADEDISGIPFVGKAGQLLNNMITAMGLRREDVFIANVVKCRPPQNRAPEFVEATTCSQFLLRQIDVVQPKVIVALGATAATYLLGVRQSLGSLRGEWHTCRSSKVAVTFHPAFLLRDPRQKGEAWKDLQRVMVELNMKPPLKA